MKWIVIVLVLIAPAALYAQTSRLSPLVLQHISQENGLSDNRITCVYKDKNELLWIGTKDGLNLLDGSSITVFKHSSADSNSICNNYITCIAGDRYGFTWIGTAAGLCCYNNKTKKISRIESAGKPAESPGSVGSIAFDNNDNIWLGTWRGLLKYQLQTRQLSFFPNNNTDFSTDITSANNINHLIVARDGSIWLATRDGLWKFNPANNQYKKIIHKQNDNRYHPLCMYVYEDADANIWAGFWNTGLKKYNPVTQQLTDYGGMLPNTSISCINEVKSNSSTAIWLNGKLLAFDEQSKKYFTYPPPVTEKDLPDVSPVYQSADGWIWLASDNGLYIYNPQQQVFSHQLFSGSITSQAVCLAGYKGGILVGGQANDFLKWKDENGDVLKDYSKLCRNSAAMLCMVPDKENYWWLGTTDGVLYTNLETSFSKWYRHTDGDSTSLPRNFITALFPDSKNDLWLFPWREGIWQMNKQTGRCKKLFDGFTSEGNKIKKLVISDAKEDASGNIWMADLDEGIIEYNAGTKQFTKPFIKEIGERAHVSRIFYKNHFLYAATYTAIIKWNENNPAPIVFTVPEEFNKEIRDIYPDNNGNWWLTTSSGLLVFNEASATFRRYTVSDGLFRNDISGNLFCSADNTMFIAAPDYFTSFKAEALYHSPVTKRKILLTAFTAGNRYVEAEENKTISLSHTENNITVKWALPVYNNPLKNQYYYQLKGIDSGWRYAGNKGEVQYANLSPGHYNLLLKAATANETEAAGIITLPFVIHPPFWKTAWFLVLAILAIGFLFYLVVRYISRRNLKEKLLRLEKEQAIEKERNRISRDMHDELGSGLTKIAILTEVIKTRQQGNEQVEKISETARSLVDNLDEMVWALNPKNDSLDKLGGYIAEYAYQYMEGTGINCIVNLPQETEPLHISEEKRRNIFMTVKEFLNNTVRHSGAKNIYITLTQHQNRFSIFLKDDGRGFDEKRLTGTGNGLKNMQQRIIEAGGNVILKSGADGTELHIIF